MDVGVPELLVILLIVGLFIYPTVVGAYRAFTSNDTGWGVGIIAAWIVGLGWLVGIIYLATHRKRA